MIKNYRLYLVKDSLYEIDDESRALFTNNKGTCIYVSNSIIKPEIHNSKLKLQINQNRFTLIYKINIMICLNIIMKNRIQKFIKEVNHKDLIKLIEVFQKISKTDL